MNYFSQLLIMTPYIFLILMVNSMACKDSSKSKDVYPTVTKITFAEQYLDDHGTSTWKVGGVVKSAAYCSFFPSKASARKYQTGNKKVKSVPLHRHNFFASHRIQILPQKGKYEDNVVKFVRAGTKNSTKTVKMLVCGCSVSTTSRETEIKMAVESKETKSSVDLSPILEEKSSGLESSSEEGITLEFGSSLSPEHESPKFQLRTEMDFHNTPPQNTAAGSPDLKNVSPVVPKGIDFTIPLTKEESQQSTQKIHKVEELLWRGGRRTWLGIPVGAFSNKGCYVARALNMKRPEEIKAKLFRKKNIIIPTEKGVTVERAVILPHYINTIISVPMLKCPCLLQSNTESEPSTFALTHHNPQKVFEKAKQLPADMICNNKSIHFSKGLWGDNSFFVFSTNPYNSSLFLVIAHLVLG